MRRLVWDANAWDDYLWWQAQDRQVLKRINTLIGDIVRNGNEGIGKPEPLKHDFAGYWSRRITDEHRLVYKVVDGEVRIAACRYRLRKSTMSGSSDVVMLEADEGVAHPGRHRPGLRPQRFELALRQSGLDLLDDCWRHLLLAEVPKRCKRSTSRSTR